MQASFCLTQVRRAIVFSLLLGFIFSMFGGAAVPSASAQQGETIDVSSAVENMEWVTFSDPALGVSVQHLGHWSVKYGHSHAPSLPGDGVTFQSEPNSFDITMVLFSIPEHMDIDTLADFLIKVSYGEVDNLQVGPERIANLPARRIEFQQPQPDQGTITMLSILVQQGTTGYWLITQDKSENIPSERFGVFDQMVASLELSLPTVLLGPLPRLPEGDAALAVNEENPIITLSTFVWPTTGYIGWIYGRDGHNGIDIWTNTSGTGNNGTSKGNPVYPPYPGKVTAIYTDPRGAQQGLRIEHTALGIWTHYFHMADEATGQSYIEPGLMNQSVDTNRLLGYMGDRIWYGSQITHLHLTVANGSADANAIDPSPYFDTKLNWADPGHVGWMHYVQRNSSTCPGPSLGSPSDGQVFSNQTVSFSWSAVSGCTFNGYTFRIKDTSNMDSGGTTIVDTGEGGTSRTENIPSQYNNRDLYWGVRAANAPNGANWSAIRRFRIEPGGGCNPNGDQAALFADPDYGGACVLKGIGNYPNPGSLGIANDSVSSIKVGGNVKLTLCRDDNYSNTCETFEGNDSNLSDNSIGNDQVSSAKVESRPVNPPSADHSIQLYKDWHYQDGYCYGDQEGNYTNLDGCPGYDGAVSSIVLKPGWSVRVYKERDLGGASKCLTSNDDDFANDTFDDGSGLNDQVSSFTLYNQSSCPAPVPSTPGNFRIDGSTQNSITIAWDDVSNETGYNIYQWNGESFVYLDSVGANATTYTETHSECGWDEFYEVGAYNGSGESGHAGWIYGTTKPCNPALVTPGNGSSHPHNYDLTFAWEPMRDSTEYLVEWWGGPYSTMQPCQWITETSCHVGTVDSGHTYSWHVRARNSAGESDWSDTWTFTIQNESSPDLIVESVTASPANPTVNQPVTFTVRIKNQGTGDIDTDFYVDLFLDRQPNTDCSDSSNVWWHVFSLAAGAAEDLTFTYNGFDTSGAHTLHAFVDTNCHIGESNEDNNIQGPVTVNVKAAPVQTTFFSTTADGWVLESSEASNRGGTLNGSAATINVGDEAGDKQYRSILSFNTAALPDNAVITAITFKVRQQGLVGANPFSTHGKLLLDIIKGAFSGSPALQAADFQAAASVNSIATIPNAPSAGWYVKAMPASAFTYINKAGVTQLRLRFVKDDNDDLAADYLRFFSGNAPAASRPRLIITYQIP